MKSKWIDRYRDVTDLATQEPVDILTAFNANIDAIYSSEDIDLEGIEPRPLEKINGVQELKSCLKYYQERGENKEVKLKSLNHEFDGGDLRLGGQAGIMSNYLSKTGNGVIFYTPFLSEKLGNLLSEKILYPSIEGDFTLKNVKDCINADRTKENMIIEFSGDKTGRVIFSSSMKGFGPYFRKGIEDHFEEIEKGTDRIILSGFHDVEGNKEAKLKKSRNQLSELETDIHMEFVHRDSDTTSLILEYILDCVESIGLDEGELRQLADMREKEYELGDELSLGDAFRFSKDLIEEYGLERVHLHTYRFHLTVAKDYQIGKEAIRKGMLFGELSAIKTADKGSIVEKDDFQDFDMEDLHMHRLDEMEHFQDFFELEGFVETGMAEVDGYDVVAVPTLIHEDPERLVGLGDIISAGAFVGEIK